MDEPQGPKAKRDDTDVKSFYRRYVGTCQRLGVTPVAHARARELVVSRDAMFAYAIEHPALQ